MNSGIRVAGATSIVARLRAFSSGLCSLAIVFGLLTFASSAAWAQVQVPFGKKSCTSSGTPGQSDFIPGPANFYFCKGDVVVTDAATNLAYVNGSYILNFHNDPNNPQAWAYPNLQGAIFRINHDGARIPGVPDGSQSVITAGVQPATNPSGLFGVSGAIVDSDGNVVAVVGCRIIKVDPNTLVPGDPTTPVQKVFSAGNCSQVIGNAFWGIALLPSSSNNDYLVTDSGSDPLRQINRPGQIILVDHVSGNQVPIANGSGGNIVHPWTIAVDITGSNPNDNGYIVSDSGAFPDSSGNPRGAIFRLNSITFPGQQHVVWGPASFNPDVTQNAPFACPLGVAVEGSTGNVLASVFPFVNSGGVLIGCSTGPGIFRADLMAHAQVTITQNGGDLSGWRIPFGMDTESSGNIVVADEGTAVLYRLRPVQFDPALHYGGNFVDPIPFSPPGGASPNFLSAPTSLGVLRVSVAAKVAVQPAITVTANNASVTYGGTMPALSATITGPGAAQAAADGITGTATTTATATSSVSGSPYTINVGTSDPNSKLVNYSVTLVNGQFTVNPAAITVTANNASVTYGGTMPALSASISGTGAAQAAADGITGTATTTATPTSAVSGSPYAITSGTSDPNHKLGNYTVNFSNGQLTINPAPITVTASNASVTYGGTMPALSASITGTGAAQAAADGITGKATTTATPTSAVSGSPYTITAGTNDPSSKLGNYSVTPVNGQFTVNPAAITVTANNANVIYGGTMPALTAAITGTGAAQAAADGITAKATTTATPLSPVSGNPYTITAGINDPNNKQGNYTVALVNGQLTVVDPAAVITSITGPTVPLQMPASVAITVNYTYSGNAPIHTCNFTTDGLVAYSSATTGSVTTVTESNGVGSCSWTNTFNADDVYSVTATISDANGVTTVGYFKYIVIYNPNAGWVTGNGTIYSGAGAYTPNPAVTGTAKFGFVSKYVPGKNTPQGNTEFQLKVAKFKFRANVYNWLIISGAKAQYSGTGTTMMHVLSHTGDQDCDDPSHFQVVKANANFILTATDGQLKGLANSPDGFRMKITDAATGAVIYDNMMGTSDDPNVFDPVAITSGRVVIHKGN